MIGLDDVRGFPLFDGLTDAQVQALLDGGEEVAIVPGEDLFREGDLAAYWWVLVDGAVELARHAGRDETVVGRMDVPGRWAGGFTAWDEHGTYLATGRGADPGRMLKVPAHELRRQVQEWFPLAVHLISGLFHTARSIESTARQRDALVSLGTLAAGLAHELNNPVAAAGRAVDALDETSATQLTALGELARGELTAVQFTALDELRRSVMPPSGPEDPLDAADREEEVAAWLEQRDLPDPWRLAGALAAVGVDAGWCRQVADLVPPTVLASALAWVASALTAERLLTEVREATDRVSQLVSAVRSYTQVDRATLQPVDVREGLESTLVMLGHKLRQGGVVVVREYAEGLPRVDGYAGELNQVWTNLVDNAIDAMPGGGTLTVAACTRGDALVVEVRDTGHGMSPEVAARAYDTFFTTKDVGRGTGLGLDIARRVVADRHHGEIGIDTSEGGTTLRVSLPLG
ncbi:sensor histidine kinase [Nocardioides sp. GXQ0305]|uniref:sensor histidine kinase n=1 Tax=Nocardioides sp. GXQ0305 TaxID=3423912 RepID=UPI003D7F0DE7